MTTITDTINGFIFYYSDTSKQALTNITRQSANTNTVLTIPDSVTTFVTGCFNTNPLSGTGGGVKNIITELFYSPTNIVQNNALTGTSGLSGFTSAEAASRLTSITLGGQITGIGGSSFRSCTLLRNVNITTTPLNRSNFTFGNSSFLNCVALQRINIDTDDITINGGTTFGSTSGAFLPTAQDFYYRYYKSFAFVGAAYAEFGGASNVVSTVARYTVSGNSITSITTPAGTSFRVIIPDSISSFINTNTHPNVVTIEKVGTGSALNASLTFITSLGFYSGINTIDANAFKDASKITSLDLSNKPTLRAGCFSGCSSINTSSLQNLRTQTLPYAASELKTAGFDDSQLLTAGYDFIFNMTGTTLTEVKKVAGSTLDTLTVPTTEGGVAILTIGNGTNAILTDGASVVTLIVSSGIATISAIAFQNITTITSLSLTNKPTLTAGCFSGCTGINSDSLQQLRTQTSPYGAGELKTAGFTVSQLGNAGYNSSQIFAAEFTPSELIAGGYNFIFNISNVNVLTEVIKVAGSTLDTLTVPTTEGGVAILTIGNGTIAILTVDASVVTLIVSSGIATIAANAFENITTITSLSLTNKPTLNSNCFSGCTNINSASLKRLKGTNGYTASELVTAGFNIVQLVLAGFISSDMSSLGFTSSQVYDSINSVSDVNSPRITEQNVLDAGYHFIFGINANRLTSITRVAGSTMSSLIIPASDGGVNIIRIGKGTVALTDITGVSSITFSSIVDSIAQNAFLNATSITSITLNNTPNLGKDCFSGCVNIDTASLQGLKARGYTVGGTTIGINLRYAGFTVAQVIRAGFTVSQIYVLNVTNGYTASELTNAGYHFIYNISNVNVLTGITKITDSTVNAITIPSSDSGISIFTIGSEVNSTLDTSVTSITVSSDITSIEGGAFSNRSSLTTLTLLSSPTLLENCFNGCVNIDTTSLQRLKNENQYTATQLKTAGFTLSQQIQVGFSVSELKAIGYTDSDLLAAGYAFIFNISNVNELTGITRVTGSTVSAITIPSSDSGTNILTIGSAVNSTLDTTITSITISSGITSIAANAFSNRSLLTTITLKGLNIQKPTLGTSCFSNCTNIDTTSLQGLKNENQYSATELKTAGFSAGQLGTSGYTVSEMKVSGYLADELRIAGYTAAQMKDDYSISELKQGGYTIYQLGPNDANYSSSQIFAADFSSSELLAAGYHFIYNISDVNVLTGITRVTDSTVNAITIPYYDGGINILTIGSAVNSTLDTTITSITISSGITTIQAGAFSNRSALTTITLEGVNTQKPELAAGCFSNCPNINTTSIQRLKNTNLYTNKDLIISGFNSSQMDNAGISSAQVYNSGNSGITNEQLISAGYHFIFNISDVNVLTGITQITGSTVNAITIPYYEGGVYILTIGSDVNSTLVESITSITVSSGITSIAANAFSGRSTLTTITLEGVNTQKPVLLENCFNGCVNVDTTSLQRLKTTNLYSSSELKTAGFSARQLQKGGYSATELQTNYTAQDILAAGYTVAQLKAAGYSAKQLKDSGYNDADILAAGYPVSQLQEAGFLASQLKAAGYLAAQLKAAGYTASQLKDADYTVDELKAAEYTIADLKEAGYDDAAILLAGYSASQLKAAGYSASQLKDANYTAAQLREGGYNDTIILASGYSVQALKAAGYTASQLRTVGFTALEILSGGYDEQAVIDAFSTSGTSEPYVPCFNENSKILCLVDGVEKELLVQNIRNGILVKTLCSGYIPVCMIGTKKIYNPGNNERTTERLYICKREMYPELNQDLIITGCHSILVDEFTDVQREKTLEKFNDIFVTDDKYRLIAAFDERAEPYNNAGEFNIYHFALENENYYYNYGIYANGLLVETCSKRYLKEKTDMTLL